MKPAYRATVAVLALSFMLSACTVDAIMSADGFRSYIGEGGAASRKTTFEVDRNYKEIGKTFADRGAACINQAALTRGGGRVGVDYSSVTTHYRATASTRQDHAELDIQEHYGKGSLVLYKEPEGGSYIIVADAIPISKNKTRINIYHAINRDAFVTAISNWAKGDDLGCPKWGKM